MTVIDGEPTAPPRVDVPMVGVARDVRAFTPVVFEPDDATYPVEALAVTFA